MDSENRPPTMMMDSVILYTSLTKPREVSTSDLGLATSSSELGGDCFLLPSSPLSKIDQQHPLHPYQWTEHASSIQLSSSPDRPLMSPASSSPLRSSPIFGYSPPPRQVSSVPFSPAFSSDHEYLQTPKSSKSVKRGRPKLDDISDLILTGSNSRSGIKCETCYRVFPREKSLAAHMRTHTGERPYKCSFEGCQKAFAQSGQLRTHERLHTGERPFACRSSECSNRFVHPNRRCPDHPTAGLMRIIPVAKPTNKRDESTISTTTKKARASLGNITSLVINSPSKSSGSNGSRKSATKSDRRLQACSRRLVMEMNQVAAEEEERKVAIALLQLAGAESLLR